MPKTIWSDEVREWYREIGLKIKALREHQRMTQVELADLAGISRPTLIGIENGLQGLSFHQAYYITQALFVDLSDLVPPIDTEEAIQRRKIQDLQRQLRAEVESLKSMHRDRNGKDRADGTDS